MSNSIAAQVADSLLEIQAIKLQPENPFTWSSGWKSPIYCDNRKVLSFPSIRTQIKLLLADLIKKQFPEADCIAGVATAGIAHAALVADDLELPNIYVRSKAKGHGLQNLIEGQAVAGQKVVLVEDLISTGGSSIKAAEAVDQAGMKALGVVALFNYGFAAADDNFKKADYPFFTLSNYEALLPVALSRGLIPEEAQEELLKWRADPASWGR